MRNFGFKVSIIDANAENLSETKVYERIKKINPKLITFVVYGQNVNAGTTNMEDAVRVSNYLKSTDPKLIISYVGSYVQALPTKALKDEKSIDFVFTNEGVYSLKNVLSLNEINESVEGIKGSHLDMEEMLR